MNIPNRVPSLDCTSQIRVTSGSASVTGRLSRGFGVIRGADAGSTGEFEGEPARG